MTTRARIQLGTLSRAAAYLDKIPGATDGENADRTDKVACALLHDFGLSRVQARFLLRQWNRRCSPPWTREELDERLENAIEHGEKSLVDSGSDSLRAPIGEGNARIECWTPIRASQLRAGPGARWLWPGFLAFGFITLLTALWKAGKTTLIADLIGKMGHGASLGEKIAPGRCLVISEESPSIWRDRCDDVGIGDHAEFVIRPFKIRPSFEEWRAFIEHVAALVQELSFSLVVVDTLLAVSPVPDENDAAQVMRALLPLHQITEAGAALLLAHHPRKSGGSGGTASRGSGALPAFVDILVELHRMPHSGPNDRRRQLLSLSRFEETPPEMVIEHTKDGYICLGSCALADRIARFTVIERIMPDRAPGLTADELRERWPSGSPPKPGKRTLDADLKVAVEVGQLRLAGKGRRGSPWRYHRPANSTAQSAMP